jgi:hypothetical protein
MIRIATFSGISKFQLQRPNCCASATPSGWKKRRTVRNASEETVDMVVRDGFYPRPQMSVVGGRETHAVRAFANKS